MSSGKDQQRSTKGVAKAKAFIGWGFGLERMPCSEGQGTGGEKKNGVGWRKGAEMKHRT